MLARRRTVVQHLACYSIVALVAVLTMVDPAPYIH
jgi:hypothetical protein